MRVMSRDSFAAKFAKLRPSLQKVQTEDSFITFCANCIGKGCLMLSDANANTLSPLEAESVRECHDVRLQAERQHGASAWRAAAPRLSKVRRCRRCFGSRGQCQERVSNELLAIMMRSIA